MIPDLRISIKDHRRGKNLKILLYRVPFGPRKFWVRMNGSRWPADGNPVSVTKLMTTLRKSLVRSL
jgi:hypothetical protein